MNLGKLGVWFFLDTLNSSQSAETAKKIEKLGYSALWLPEAVGKNPMVLASWLLANTEKLVPEGIEGRFHTKALLKQQSIKC